MIRMRSIRNILESYGLPFDENGKMVLPEWVKRISIDVGLSFDAPHSQNWIDNDPNHDLVVFGFEANPFWVDYLMSPVKNNNFKDFHTYTVPLKYEHINHRMYVVPVALANVPSPCCMDLYVPQLSEGCGSLLMHKPFMGQTVKTFSVPVHPLKEFFDLIPFDRIECVDYLKVDVQGCDIDVLLSAGTYLRDRVAYVTAEPETNQYFNAEKNSAEYMTHYMQTQGFERVHHPNTADPTFFNPRFLNKKDTYIWQHY